MLNKKNFRGQIGETSTWVVATIVIIFVLIISVYATSLLSKTKKVDYYSDSIFSKGYSRTQDFVLKKSLYSYFLTSDEAKRVEIMKDLEEKYGMEGTDYLGLFFYPDTEELFFYHELNRMENNLNE